jgi:DNA modification methylase
MTDLQATEIWSIDRVQFNARNARKHPPYQIDQLRSSFQKYGQVWPLLVREDGTLIAGAGRLEAAKLEGYREVRVLVAKDWTEEQCRAFALLDNRVALNATWDNALLGLEIADLSSLGVDISELGFAEDEIAKLLHAGNQGKSDPDALPEEPTTPVTVAGDIWMLGRHRLLCGDATDTNDVERVLAGVKPHLMVTDPPYGVNYEPAWRHTAKRSTGELLSAGKHSMGRVTNDDRCDWTEAWKLFPGDVAYVWHSGLHGSSVQISLENAGFQMRAQIIWNKNVMIISRGHYHFKHEPCWYAVRKAATGHWSGDRKQTSVWDIPIVHATAGDVDDGKNPHGTQKPVECMKRPIENNSSPGQTVYDPFVGSGTTIIAAETSGRVCLAIDIDPIYVDVAVLRWQEFTGEVATMDGDGRDFYQVAAERVPQVVFVRPGRGSDSYIAG